MVAYALAMLAGEIDADPSAMLLVAETWPLSGMPILSAIFLMASGPLSIDIVRSANTVLIDSCRPSIKLTCAPYDWPLEIPEASPSLWISEPSGKR